MSGKMPDLRGMGSLSYKAYVPTEFGLISG